MNTLDVIENNLITVYYPYETIPEGWQLIKLNGIPYIQSVQSCFMDIPDY